MEQVRAWDRRTGHDRRMGGGAAYTGPERRALRYRRSGTERRTGWPAVCIYCGQVIGDHSGWSQASETIESTVECRTGICMECSAKRFPQFYSDD